MAEAKPELKKQATRYHHGDLRAALLRAAESELEEKGVEGFSLRGVAKRAGVSHAAPAHHFGDVNGLLTALAAVGFERFLEKELARQRKAGKDGHERLIAAVLSYVNFAMVNPKLFRLMFASDRADHTNAELGKAAGAAFEHLVKDVEQLRGVDPRTHDAAMLDVMAVWGIAHGLADLMNAGLLRYLLDLPQAKRKAAIADFVDRLLVR